MQKISDAKERIIDTASRLFFQQGYNLTGINQVIEEANVAKSTLYQYFPSKDDLCAEYLKRKHSIFFELLQDFIKKYKTPHSKLLATFDYLAVKSKEDSYRGCSFLNIIAEIPDEHSKVLDAARANKSTLRRYFSELVALLPQESKRSEKLGDRIYLLFEGAITESQVQKDSWPILLAKSTAKEMIQ
ncbi:MAG TPA: TetR/AcrR family transcriptional regulator [Cytophagaceae bacterium]|jgi:AcrR family transcriptional regulator